MCGAPTGKPVQLDLVLFSGGIDSTTLAAQLMGTGRQPELLFVDYGQRSRAAERRSSRAVAARWDCELSEVTLAGLVPGEGEISGRNALLVHVALAHRPHASRLHLGIHAGSGYRDCSPRFVELMQRSLDFHTDGAMRLSAPFIGMSKGELVVLARASAVPLELTHSCEAGDKPCGRCRSCRDRLALDVR
jgi:7-cyano-7-deazaguanine synthase